MEDLNISKTEQDVIIQTTSRVQKIKLSASTILSALRRNKKPILIAGFLIILVFYIISLPPDNFPANKVFRVEKGDALNTVAKNLSDEGYLRYPSLFNVWTMLVFGENSIKAGSYVFEKPISLFGLAHRLANGLRGESYIRMTFIEGWTAEKMANALEEMRILVKDNFLQTAYMTQFSEFSDLFDGAPVGANLEGYLFPDTYFVMSDGGAESIIRAMLLNLDKKITPEMRTDIAGRGLNIYQIITMASLIEKEAHNPEDRKIISGILWKRLDIGMPLQVDASLTYVLEKASLKLTEKDLKYDSPYNTYLYAGLPLGPIANPGLDAITAAIYPASSDYLYYLSDSDGNTYFAKTFEEHKINKTKYLK